MDALQHRSEVPSDTSICALRANPKSWNQRLVRVSGYATHGYEESSFVDPNCGGYNNGREIWMEYGGLVGTDTMYFGARASSRVRKKDLTVEGFQIPLRSDESFRRLDAILQSRPHERGVVVVGATVEGRFFAGKEPSSNDALSLGGYGHFGCCSLLAIQSVQEVANKPLGSLEMKRFSEAFPPPPPLPKKAGRQR